MSATPAPSGLEVQVRKRLGEFTLDVAFEGPGAGVTAIFGASGAGKSQLLAAVAGATRPDAGRVVLGGRVLFDGAGRIDVAMERRAVGWVFQEGRLFPHLSVEANLRYGERRARGRDAGVRFDDLVEALGIAPLLARRPAGLSGGERQRIAIGRALLSQPALLMMDEPLASLDLPRRAEILPYLERLKALVALPILYVTHALSEVVRLADHLVVLDQGRVAAHGPVAEVLVREDIPILMGRPDAAAVLDVVVAGHDETRELTRLSLGGTVLLVPRLPLAEGDVARAAVLARDVLLASEPPRGLSARNVLAAEVERLAPARADGVVLVRVRLVGGPALLAALTRDAIRSMDLKPGVRTYAVVKSVAIEGLSPGGLIRAFEA